MDRPTLGKARFEAIKARVAAKRAAEAAGTPIVETVQHQVACFETAQQIIDFAMKNEGKIQ